MSFKSLICSDKYTAGAQFLFSFSLGILFSGFNGSIFFLFIFLLGYEIVYYATIGRCSWSNWSAKTRFVVVIGYITGWFIGRTVHDMGIVIHSKDYDEKTYGKVLFPPKRRREEKLRRL